MIMALTVILKSCDFTTVPPFALSTEEVDVDEVVLVRHDDLPAVTPPHHFRVSIVFASLPHCVDHERARTCTYMLSPAMNADISISRALRLTSEARPGKRKNLFTIVCMMSTKPSCFKTSHSDPLVSESSAWGY